MCALRILVSNPNYYHQFSTILYSYFALRIIEWISIDISSLGKFFFSNALGSTFINISGIVPPDSFHSSRPTIPWHDLVAKATKMIENYIGDEPGNWHGNGISSLLQLTCVGL
jgi:hypothetical protein